jgi:hypothetical protein
MTTKKVRYEKRRQEIVRKQAATIIIEEVETFEDLGPRMQELLLNSPEGTRIYLRVRQKQTMN